ncbi:hypothetical protein SynSYN20_01039 [Synechococcus sp. SYN20]|nr:hypothetical protein SynSYN20_01039 [Synechococcus sp. SYN20]
MMASSSEKGKSGCTDMLLPSALQRTFESGPGSTTIRL